MAWEKIIDRKLNQDFVGHAEKATYTFRLTPEQVPGTQWALHKVIDSHIESLAAENSLLLELRVWEDTEPTWWTDYYVEVIATASPLFWNVIIAGVLFLLLAIAIWFTIKEVEDIVEYIGEKAPGTLPLLAIAGIGAIALAGIYLVRRKP